MALQKHETNSHKLGRLCVWLSYAVIETSRSLTLTLLLSTKMSALISSPTVYEVRYLIKFVNAQNVAWIEIHRQLCSLYGLNVMRQHIVRRWCRDFSKGWQNVLTMSVADDQLSLIQQLPSVDGTLKIYCLVIVSSQTETYKQLW